MKIYICPEHECPGHKELLEALLSGQHHIAQNQEKIMTALDNLKAADQALKDEITTFLADIAGRLGSPDADVQAIADDINAQISALQGADPGPPALDPLTGRAVTATGTATGDGSGEARPPVDAAPIPAE